MCDTVRFKAVFVLLLLLCLLSAAAHAQPAFQVADLNTTQSGGIDAELSSLEYLPRHFASKEGAVFFQASDGIHGIELWRTDGTEAGTRLFADVCPGSCSSLPRSFAVVGESVFFVADDGLHGPEIWKSDGTAAGTALVRDLIPHNNFVSRIHGLAGLDGLLLFSLSTFYPTDREELWRSDGTAAGTFLLAEFDLANSNGSFAPLLRSGGKLFFSVGNSAYSREIWTTDGTVAGTALLKDAGYDNAREAAETGGRVLFTAYGPEGSELWASDGTQAGTVLLKDLNPGAGSSSPNDLTVLGEEVFFFTYDGAVKTLWRSNGTAAGTLPVKPVPSNSAMLTATEDRLFFFSSCELWTSDGTQAGTVPVETIQPSSDCPWYAVPYPLAEGGAELLFVANDGIHGEELWKSDGSPAGTTLVADLNPGIASSLSEFLPALFAGGRWYFQRYEGGFGGLQLWTTDGTAAGTRRLQINHQPSPSGLLVNTRGELKGPRAFFDLNGTLLFPGSDDATGGADLWRSDGTVAGTSLVKALHNSFGSPGEFTRVGDTVFFRSNDIAASLWKTDGTPAGTQRLYEYWNLHGAPYFFTYLTVFGNNLLFLGPWSDEFIDDVIKSDGTPEGTQVLPFFFGYPYYVVSLGNVFLVQAGFEGDELFKSDGTAAGTARLGSIVARQPVAEPELSSSVRDGVLLFAGTTSETGEELWRSDGTEAGTFLLAETVPGPDSKPLGPFAVAGATLFFAAAGNELWKNDGAGTGLVRTLPGDPVIGIRSLTPLGAKVYFSYDDGEHGRELWVSDGTEAGTRMVEDLLPGPGSSHPRQLHVEGNILLFSATDGVHGVEPWRSDGTALGTRMLQDIAPGALPSSPVEFTASGPNVYFAANDGTTGFELWALPRPALLATFADVPAEHWAWRFVEALAANGLTNGCGADRYCPDLQVKRAETAAFLVRAAHGPAFVPPPATGTVFQDVPAGHWAAPWIEQLAADGVTSGCGGGNFCPADPLTRAEAAVLLLKARHGSGFVPPPATGTVFNDVPASHWAAAWIEKLAAEGITGGCGGGSYCPARTATRAEMAAFLAKTFGLVLP
jgi:ELWxxDGT repeat protein